MKKLSTAILLGISFTSNDDRYDAMFLNNFVTKVDHDAGKLTLTRVEMPVPQAAIGGMIK